MSLEVTGNTIPNANTNVKTKREERAERGGRDKEEKRKGMADKAFKSIADMVKQRASSASLSPRTELIRKWLTLSLNSGKELLPEYAFRILSISKEQGYRCKFPAIVVAANKKGTDRVVCHTLLIDDGVPLERLGKRQVYQGREINQIPVPSNVWDSKYEEYVQSEVANAFSRDEKNPILNVKFASSGCTVVPATLHIAAYGEKPSNDENPLDNLYVMIVESLTAFDRFIRRDTSQVCFGEIFDKKKTKLQANIDQVPAIEFDVLGNPIRSDFCISISQKRRNNRDDRDEGPLSYNDNVDVESGAIIRVTGFVEPYYTNPENDRYQTKPKNFGINIVITSISGDSSPSPELFLYGIASATALTNYDSWVEGFKPAIINATPDRNLGGLFLEIEGRDGEPMERKTYPNTATDELLDDIDYLFSDQVRISVDCVESGINSWITDMILFNETDEIIDAANNLTAFEFDDISEGEDDIIERSETRRFYLGTAEGENGVVDLREAGYLKLINMFNENTSLKAAQEWDHSLQDESLLGLSERFEKLEEIYGHGGFKITGTADRVVINPDFLNDLVEALEEKGMLPDVEDWGHNNRPRSRLGANEVHGTFSSRNMARHYSNSNSGYSARGRGGYRSRD